MFLCTVDTIKSSPQTPAFSSYSSSPMNTKNEIPRLAKFLTNAQEKKNKVKRAAELIAEHKAEIFDLTIKIAARKAYYEYADICALKIQKLFRGHLVRSQYDTEILKIRRKAVQGCMSEMRSSDNKNLFNTGKKPIWAAQVITKFMKRMLFLFKIGRIQRTYLTLKMIKEEESMIGIKIGLRIIFNYKILKWKRFEKYREVRLKEIRKNVAILAVKIYYSSNQLSFRLLMRRFKKYKRAIRMHKSGSVNPEKNEGLSTRDHISTRSDIFSNPSADNLKNVDNLGGIVECASLTSTEFLKIEKTRKDKIYCGLISYNIPKSKEPVAVLPYLYQKDMQEEVSPQCHYFTPTHALVNRISVTNPLRQSPIKKMLKQLPAISSYTPKIEKRKLIFDKEHLPNFTRPTLSSSYGRSKEEDNSEAYSIKRSIRENTTLYNQTFSGMQKLLIPEKESLHSLKGKISNEKVKNFHYMGIEKNPRIQHVRAQTTVENIRRIEAEKPCLVALVPPFTSTLSKRIQKISK